MRGRIAVLAVYSICIFFVETWWGMLVFAAIAGVICAICKPPFAKMIKLGLIAYVIAAFTVLFNMFQFGANGLVFTFEGLVRGCFFALRIILLVLVSLMVCLRADALGISGAIRFYLSPLAKIKAPLDDISTILSITLRFIPLTAAEYVQIKDAQWARGANFDEGPITDRVKSHCAILVPLFIGMFRKADALALSMDARGYGIKGLRRSSIDSAKMNHSSVLLTIVFCAALVLSAIFL